MVTAPKNESSEVFLIFKRDVCLNGEISVIYLCKINQQTRKKPRLIVFFDD